MDTDLKDWLEYIDGEFFWKKQNGRCKAGSKAGSLKNDGYIGICVNRKHYKAHRLAWFFIYGEFPSMEIDHIDRNKVNNKIENLRLATRKQNVANTSQRKKITNLPTGVAVLPSGRFRARIRINNVMRYIGSFDNPEQAHFAYKEVHKKLFGEFSPI